MLLLRAKISDVEATVASGTTVPTFPYFNGRRNKIILRE